MPVLQVGNPIISESCSLIRAHMYYFVEKSKVRIVKALGCAAYGLYPEGVFPVIFLKVLLNADFEL